MSLLKKRIAEQAQKLKTLEPLEVDPHPNVTGVLLSDEITYYAQNHHLIIPFEPDDKLKPAGYELTVGDEYFLSGEFHDLEEKVTIPPFEVAVLKTTEIVRLPRFMIARWNIRVKHAYSGLLWVGGPQVDPGYVGNLFCPIYNLSDKPVTLSRGAPLALMDFVKTTPFDAQRCKRYPFPPKRVVMQEYSIDDLRSALFTRAGRKLDEFEETIKALETRFVTFTQISFSIFALVIALVALSSRASAGAVFLSASILGPFTVAISVAALLIAIFSYLQWRLVRLVADRYGTLMAARARAAQTFLRRSWWTGIAISVALPVLAGIGIYFLSKPYFSELKESQATQLNLEKSIVRRSDDLAHRIAKLEALRESTLSELEELKTRMSAVDQSRTPAQQNPPAK